MNRRLPATFEGPVLLRRWPLCKLEAFLLRSINGDLRLTLADAGFHYCQRYFSKKNSVWDDS